MIWFLEQKQTVFIYIINIHRESQFVKPLFANPIQRASRPASAHPGLLNSPYARHAEARRFRASANFWQTCCELQTDAGEPLVRFDSGGLFLRLAGVIVQPAAVRLAELPLLITLGWYLAVMMQQDSAAVVVVAAKGLAMTSIGVRQGVEMLLGHWERRAEVGHPASTTRRHMLVFCQA